jgi:hypothetical protein
MGRPAHPARRTPRSPLHSPARGPEQLRYHICAEAARIMAEEGVNDFHSAKHKAAARLDQPVGRNLPSNLEVETALREYLELFDGPRRMERLRRLRERALEAMRFFSDFDPRLAGAALSGTVTPSSVIELHLAADHPEQIALRLQEHRIPHDQRERRLRFGGERLLPVPAFSFRADEAVIEVLVFTPVAMREAPLSPVDGRPMPRAGLAEVERLLA